MSEHRDCDWSPCSCRCLSNLLISPPASSSDSNISQLTRHAPRLADYLSPILASLCGEVGTEQRFALRRSVSPQMPPWQRCRPGPPLWRACFVTGPMNTGADPRNPGHNALRRNLQNCASHRILLSTPGKTVSQTPHYYQPLKKAPRVSPTVFHLPGQSTRLGSPSPTHPQEASSTSLPQPTP